MNIEDIILRRSARGMDLLRRCLPEDFCSAAAEALIALRRGNILLTTGFYIGGAGAAETDGPVGAFFLAMALNALGFDCTVVTDVFCHKLFYGAEINSLCVDINASERDFSEILDKYSPTALISVERCGVNANGDYANMRGASIAEHTARIDLMFEEGVKRGIPTFGVGDGGNEIGMGRLGDVISRELLLVPCAVATDYLIIATVSNWGCYGLCAALRRISGKSPTPSSDEVGRFLKRIVALGAVDGVTGRAEHTVDGFPKEVELEVVKALEQITI